MNAPARALISRRALIAASLAAAPIPAWARDFSTGAFTHGVASGDPLPDRVMLWTRFAHNASGHIGWEIADDEAFSRIAARGNAIALARNDFCVHVDAGGLHPGRRFYYRFLSGAGPSPTGRTLTAPHASAPSLTAALFSCANLAWGYFHAYGHAAARDDIDIALHAGDYIYELERGTYPSAADAVPGRVIEPAGETIPLADYYQRYASYHADPDLLDLRRLKPICVTWDDHEIADNTWREGALGHNSNEGAFADRRAAAAKAYFDWMPIRRPTARGLRLYRHFDWGDIARIVFLDTRVAGRDRQLSTRDISESVAQGGGDAVRFATEIGRTVLNDPSRSMLGAQQEDWLARTLAASKRSNQPWQLIVQQVVVGDQIAPAGMTRMLRPDAAPSSRAWFASGEELSALGLPWNLDARAGYPAARTRFLNSCAANAANAIVLGGDSHNGRAHALAAPEQPSRLAALEFAGGSVSSPGFERHLSNAAPGEREAMLRSANPHLAWCDLTHRGYATFRLTRASCETEWVLFPDVRSPERQAPVATRLRAEPGSNTGPRPWTIDA